MSPADRANLDFSQRLNRGLRSIASAQGMEAVLRATMRIAHELADATGLCVAATDQTRCLITTAEDSAVTRLAGDSPLHQLIGEAAQGDQAVLQHRPQLHVELPAGGRIHTTNLLTVPLDAASGYTGLAFFWSEGAVPSAQQLVLLPGLAWTTCLALRSQREADELKRSRAAERSQLIEFQHRARNVLALVRSIIRRSSLTAASSEDFASHLEGRVSAMARTQAALIIDGQTGPELEDLIRTELAANAVRDAQLAITGPAIRLMPRAAETMALTLHELTTNALKFGALTVPAGHIAVNWSIQATPALRLRWSWVESNVSVEQTASRHRGFGRELIESVLPYELGATTRLTWAPAGVRCEIDLPINERTTVAERARRRAGNCYEYSIDSRSKRAADGIAHLGGRGRLLHRR